MKCFLMTTNVKISKILDSANVKFRHHIFSQLLPMGKAFTPFELTNMRMEKDFTNIRMADLQGRFVFLLTDQDHKFFSTYAQTTWQFLT